MKKNLLSDYEKEIVYNIVMTLKGRTQKQKARFNMYYSLGPNANEKNSMSKIAKFYECSESVIKGSISAINSSLYKIPDSKILLLQKIIGDKNGV